ncbi:hypothetical protein, partial [Escherichia coli]|uniref:hypothetical protein n=1 Tax=Escherichia coli TaxID=562 RepID=UPI003D7B8E72
PVPFFATGATPCPSVAAHQAHRHNHFLKRGSYKIHPAKHRNFANSKGDIGRRRVKNIARRAANTADTPVNIREVNFPGTIRVSFIKKQRRQRVFYPLNCGAVGIFDPRDFNIDDFLDRGTYENNGSSILMTFLIGEHTKTMA